MDKAIDGIKSDTQSWNGYKKDEEGKPLINDYGQLIKNNGETEEISASKLGNIAKIVAPTFFQSPESQYYIDEKFGRSMPEFNKLPKDTQDQLIAYATQDIIRRGAPQIFSKTKSGIDYQNLSEHALGAINDNKTTTTESESMPGTLIKIPDIVDEMKFNNNGELLMPKNKVVYQDPETISDTFGAGSYDTKESLSIDRAKNQVNFIVNLKKEHPELKDLESKQVIEAYKGAVKSLKSESIPLNTIGEKAAKSIGESLSRDLNQRKIYLMDDKGQTETGSKDEVLEKLGINQSSLQEQLRNGVGGYTQAGPSAGAYYVYVNDKNDVSRRVIIAADNEMQKIFRTSQSVNEARKSFIKTEVTPFEEFPNYTISVEPSISKDGNANWKYTEVFKDKDGSIISKKPTDLNTIRQEEKKHLETSGYLHSKIAK